MKNKISIASAILAIGLITGFTSCKPDYETDFTRNTLEVPHKSQALITFDREGGERSIVVNTNVAFDSWQATSNAEWCEVTKSEGKVTVKASTYDGYQRRKAMVTVKYGHQAYNVHVEQLGYEATLEFPLTNGFYERRLGYLAYVAGNATSFVAPVNTNLTIDHVVVPDTTSWVRFDNSQEITTDEQGLKLLQFQLDPNTTDEDRYSLITLQSSQNWEATKQFIILQSRKGYMVLPSYGETSHTITDLGGDFRLPYTHSQFDGKFTVEVSSDAAEWLSVTRDTLAATVDELWGNVATNLTDQARTGTITLTAESSQLKHVVTITQEAYKDVPPYSVVDATSTAGAGTITVRWNKPSVVNYKTVKVSMYNATLNRTEEKTIDDVNTTSVTFDNTFKFAGDYVFTITTYGYRGTATNSPVTVTGTSNAWKQSVEIPLTLDMLSDNASPSDASMQLPSLIDNDPATFYHTRTNATTDDNKQPRVQIALKEPISGELYFSYVGKSGTRNDGDVTKARIYVSNTGSDNDSDWDLLGQINYTLPTTGGQLVNPRGNVKANGEYNYIRFVPQGRRGGNPGYSSFTGDGSVNNWWNVAELKLFQVRDENWAQSNLDQIFSASAKKSR